MKKNLSVLLALVFMLSLCACGGTNCDADKGDASLDSPIDPATQYEWVEVSGGIEITKYLGTDTKVVVPATIGNKAVISVSTAFSGNLTLEELELPNKVKKADLTNCESLKHLIAPGVSIVAEHHLVLTGCTSLEYLFLPGIDTLLTYMRDLPDSVQELILSGVQDVYVMYVLRGFGSESLKTLDISGAIRVTGVDLVPYQDECPIEITLNENINKCVVKEEYDSYTDTYTKKYTAIYEDGGKIGDEQISYSTDDTMEIIDITEKNRAQIYCEVFNCGKITINGVTYTNG